MSEIESQQLQLLRRRLIEADRWRVVLHQAHKTIEYHSPCNTPPNVRLQRLEDSKRRMADMDVQIAKLKSEIDELSTEVKAS